ncbi:hypothetical protein D3C76_1658750 [compost metagenome]
MPKAPAPDRARSTLAPVVSLRLSGRLYSASRPSHTAALSPAMVAMWARKLPAILPRSATDRSLSAMVLNMRFRMFFCAA